MSVSIVESNAEFVTLQLVVPLQKTFLETEETIQSVLNQAGTLFDDELTSSPMTILIALGNGFEYLIAFEHFVGDR